MVVDRVLGDVDHRRRRRQYKQRVRALPLPYRRSVRALERYLGYVGSLTVGDIGPDTFLAMVEDLVDPIEGAARRSGSVREVVGDDPVGYAEAILRQHTGATWPHGDEGPAASVVERRVRADVRHGIEEERRRLVAAVARADSRIAWGRS